MWIGVLPSVWSVVINVFMLLVPWQIKRLEKGEGRLFAMLFSIGNRISVVLAYLPPSLGAVGLAFPLLLGFYVWEFFMLVAAAQFYADPVGRQLRLRASNVSDLTSVLLADPRR